MCQPEARHWHQFWRLSPQTVFRSGESGESATEENGLATRDYCYVSHGADEGLRSQKSPASFNLCYVNLARKLPQKHMPSLTLSSSWCFTFLFKAPIRWSPPHTVRPGTIATNCSLPCAWSLANTARGARAMLHRANHSHLTLSTTYATVS